MARATVHVSEAVDSAIHYPLKKPRQERGFKRRRDFPLKKRAGSYTSQSVPGRISGIFNRAIATDTCCGLAPRGDGSPDGNRRPRPLLVLFVVCSRKLSRRLSGLLAEYRQALEQRMASRSQIRALRPASTSCFPVKNGDL